MSCASGGLVDPLADSFRLDGSSGTAYVLVHGFTGNAAHFRPLAGRLAERRKATVIAPLLPGHGRSIEDLRTAGRTEWLAAVVDAVRLVGDHRAIHVVGLSMGGHLGILAARQGSVATVTTINTPVRFRDRRIRLAWMAAPFASDLTWQEPPIPELDPEVEPFWIHATGFPVRAAAELYAVARDGCRAARELRVPTLVIQSRVDDTTHPVSGPRLRAACGGRTKLVWLESAMHNALFSAERTTIESEILART